MTPGSTKALHGRFDLVRTECLSEDILATASTSAWSIVTMHELLSCLVSLPDMQPASLANHGNILHPDLVFKRT